MHLTKINVTLKPCQKNPDGQNLNEGQHSTSYVILIAVFHVIAIVSLKSIQEKLMRQNMGEEKRG